MQRQLTPAVGRAFSCLSAVIVSRDDLRDVLSKSRDDAELRTNQHPVCIFADKRIACQIYTLVKLKLR